MTDRELLEAAAKAAGLRVGRDPSGAKNNGRWDLYWDLRYGCLFWHDKQAGSEYSEPVVWNPLTDDGDALRLMARLNINVYYRENINGAFVIADHKGIQFCPESLDGPHEDVATRRAIVRAAAALAEALP